MWIWVNSRSGNRQGSLMGCSPWGLNESDMTERLNWTELKDGPSLKDLWTSNLSFLKYELQYHTCPRTILSNAHINFFQNSWWTRNILQRSKPETRQSKGQDKIQVVTRANLFSVFRARKWKLKFPQLSDSLWLHGIYSPWNSPGQNTGVGSYCLLQSIIPIQESNPGLPYYTQILYQLRHKGSPRILGWVDYPFSTGSSWPRNQTRVSCIASGFFTSWATDFLPI